MSSGPIQVCSFCGQSYWSMAATGPDCEVCPACMGAAVPVAAAKTPSESYDAQDDRQRFVTLSALPPEKRLLPRSDGTRPGLMVPRRLAQMEDAPRSAPEPRSNPPSCAISPPPEESVPVPAVSVNFRQLGFNCPSCYTVLVIKDPESYDGRAAPCPYCHVAIMPPRIAPPSPFTLLEPPVKSGEAILPIHRQSRWKTFDNRRTETPSVPAEV